jgi:hypothetical protein
LQHLPLDCFVASFEVDYSRLRILLLAMTTPHPAFAHLLPACGEKGLTIHYSLTCRVIAAESRAAQRRMILSPLNSNHSMATISYVFLVGALPGSPRKPG